MRNDTPRESTEQELLFRWADLAAGKHPELRMLYHIPNEGKRSPVTGARMRAEGLRRGVPDICLPVPRHPFHGLYIELKRRYGSKTTEEQRGWIEALNRCGYRAVVCKGWDEAREEILRYLGG